MVRWSFLPAGLVVLLAAPLAAATATPATPTTIGDVLGHAAPGATIRLAPGSYPVIDLRDRHWATPVVVDATAAQLRAVHLTAVSGLTWHGGTFDGGSVERAGFNILRSDHIVIDGTTVRHFTRVGIGLGSTSDTKLTNNTFDDMGSDGIDVALSRRILVDHNRCLDSHPTEGAHPDCVQLWSRPTEAPTADVVVSNNEAIGNTQGFTAFNHVRDGVDDGGFDRITIEHNHARVGVYHGIAVFACRGCVVRHNRVETLPNPANPRVRAWIKVVGSDDAVQCDNRAESFPGAPGGGRCPD